MDIQILVWCHHYTAQNSGNLKKEEKRDNPQMKQIKELKMETTLTMKMTQKEDASDDLKNNEDLKNRTTLDMETT